MYELQHSRSHEGMRQTKKILGRTYPINDIDFYHSNFYHILHTVTNYLNAPQPHNFIYILQFQMLTHYR